MVPNKFNLRNNGVRFLEKRTRVLKYDNMGWVTKKTVGQLWRKFEEARFEKKDGKYDTRDGEVIREWTRDLAKKIQS